MLLFIFLELLLSLLLIFFLSCFPISGASAGWWEGLKWCQVRSFSDGGWDKVRERWRGKYRVCLPVFSSDCCCHRTHFWRLGELPATVLPASPGPGGRGRGGQLGTEGYSCCSPPGGASTFSHCQSQFISFVGSLFPMTWFGIWKPPISLAFVGVESEIGKVASLKRHSKLQYMSLFTFENHIS